MPDEPQKTNENESTIDNEKTNEAVQSNSDQVPSEVEPTTTASSIPEDQNQLANTVASPQVVPTAFNDAASPQKKSKKKLIVGLIIAVIIFLLLVAGALAYFLWYQNPQKVLGDAIANVYSAKATHGKFTYTGSDSNSGKVEVTFNAAAADSQYNADVDAKIEYQSKNIEVKGAGAYDKNGNAYFKLSGLKTAIANLGAGEAPATYTSIIEKYDDKWVKISASDLKAANPDAEKSQKCLEDINMQLKNKSFQNDIAKSYRKNQFIVVKEKLGSKDGNIGYKIDNDKTKAKSFAEDFKQTKSYDAIKANCTDAFDSSDSSTDTSSNDNSSVNVWISRWSHQLKTLDVSSDSTSGKASFTTDLDYDKSQNVTIPASSIPFSELQKDIEALTYSTYGGIQSRAQTSENLSLAYSIQKKVEAYNAINGHYPTYKELLAAKDEAMLTSDQKARLTQANISGSNAEKIQFVLTSKSSGYISYYDAQSAEAKKISFGASTNGA